MKVRGAGKVHYDSGPNMTPLVDVIMVILIFLMMCGTFAGESHYLVSSTPVMNETGATQKHYDIKKVPTLVRVNVEFYPLSYQSWMNDRQKAAMPAYVVKVTGDHAGYIHYAAVVTKLQELRASYSQQGLNADDLQVVLCPSDLVKYQDVVAVYQAGPTAGFTQVGFAAAHVEALGGASHEYR